MTRICSSLICALFALFVGAQTAATVPQAESACGPADVKFNVKTIVSSATPAAAPTGKAQVYVIEDWVPSGATTGFQNPVIRVGMDGHWISADQGNSYLLFTVEPGEHHLCASWQPGHFEASHATTALYAFSAKADQTDFFRVRMPGLPNAFGVWHSVTFGVLLNRVNVDEGELLVGQYPTAMSTAKK